MAAAAAGVARTYIYEARRADPEFAETMDAIRHDVLDLLEKSAVQRALDGSDRLMEFMLKALRPDKYRETVKLEHGGTINHELVASVARENRELEEQLGLGGDAAASGDPSPRALASGN